MLLRLLEVCDSEGNSKRIASLNLEKVISVDVFTKDISWITLEEHQGVYMLGNVEAVHRILVRSAFG